MNKYASTFPMAACEKKTCNYRRKKRGVKNKYAIAFASTQLRITTLRKYSIDPKAYLGRCAIDNIKGILISWCVFISQLLDF